MDRKTVNRIKALWESKGLPTLGNKELEVKVNAIRWSIQQRGYCYSSFGDVYFAVHKNGALYDISAFKSVESWHQGMKDDAARKLKEKMAASKIQVSWDEFVTLYDTGEVTTKSGLILKEKSWDKKTYEATFKDKELAKTKVIEEYRRKILEHGPMTAGTEVRLSMEFK